ncbi:DUF6790 family protein [Microvirga lotononidis]|uniref:Uncharacterized protein n=1 Tax=Microvirga lotononidis TaxID=864069 RepID=I4YZB0_9HYPH|nr:DUF6790 family protein [Microvirga lotononidis]EIM29302.1 hypothetical protein MicloDRAFT_00017740 [Microvirga lotononidis]WQO29129.1 DUF6790 family protein [Microvirga lotononidis]
MEQAIRFLLSNFTLTLFVVGLIASLIALLRRPRPWSRATVAEALLSWFLFFSLGVSFLYNFVMHVFFSETAAAFIGWQTSPFQKEVGFASLGFAVVSFMAFKGGRGMRLAALVGPACFLWGAAAGHVQQMIAAHNFAPGNAGVIFYTDILLPLFGLGLLWMRGRSETIGETGLRTKASPLWPSRH